MTMPSVSVIEAADAPMRIVTPIEHITKVIDPATGQWDGTLLAHVTVTSETPDSQGEIVDYDAFKAAAPGLMKWAVLNEMHDPDKDDAGTILKLYFDDTARRVEADVHVVDPVAVKKVLNRVYKMVSIGGIKLGTRVEQHGTQALRRITKLITEHLALVPRGSNPDAMIAKQFVLAKRAQETGMDDVDAGMPSPVEEAASVDLTGATRTPEQIAIDETREALAKVDTDPNVGGGVDRDKLPAEDFAGPNRSFPIVKPGDVSDAASSLGRAKGNRDAIKAKIIVIARRKGAAFVAQLPDAWKDGDMEKADETAEEAKAPFPGAKPPFKGKKAKKMKKARPAPDPVAVEEKRLRKEAARLRKTRKARAVLAKEQKRLAKGNDALDSAADAIEAVGEAMAEEAKEQSKGSDESKDLANLQTADEALHQFQADESAEPDEDMAKRYRVLRKKASQMRRYRKAADAVKRETKRIAKVGRRNSSADQALIDSADNAIAKLGATFHLDKTGMPVADATPDATMAKADTTTLTMREVLAEMGCRPGVIEGIEAKVTAADERSKAQGDLLAKIAKTPSGGGPATPYAPVYRGASPDGVSTDRGELLSKAAAVVDDPRLREQLAGQAALEQIRQRRTS